MHAKMFHEQWSRIFHELLCNAIVVLEWNIHKMHLREWYRQNLFHCKVGKVKSYMMSFGPLYCIYFWFFRLLLLVISIILVTAISVRTIGIIIVISIIATIIFIISISVIIGYFIIIGAKIIIIKVIIVLVELTSEFFMSSVWMLELFLLSWDFIIIMRYYEYYYYYYHVYQYDCYYR